MSEKERTSSTNTNNLLFYGVTTLIIIILFLLFVPKIASSLFPFKRQMLWNNFLIQVQKDKKIDPQKYWEFREFYSPGFFTDNKTATSDQVTKALNTYGVSPSNNFSTLLTFHAPLSESIDTLTTETALKNLVKIPSASSILFQNDTSLMYKSDDHHVIITFLLPLSEMKKANGFFDYGEKDKKLVEGKNWFSILRITLP